MAYDLDDALRQMRSALQTWVFELKRNARFDQGRFKKKVMSREYGDICDDMEQIQNTYDEHFETDEEEEYCNYLLVKLDRLERQRRNVLAQERCTIAAPYYRVIGQFTRRIATLNTVKSVVASRDRRSIANLRFLIGDLPYEDCGIQSSYTPDMDKFLRQSVLRFM